MKYNQAYLQSLIDERVEENLHLDYKAAAALDKINVNKTKESISKDVAAFANADGGLVIYGITEDKTNKHLPNAIDPVDRNNVSKEWLEQIIQSSIQPRIDGIHIHPIEIDSDLRKVVYVVVVPKSITAHQSNDYKYYRRHNFNNLPMYDHEIRDILNRVKHPKIQIEITLHTQAEDQEDGYHLKVYANNIGGILANYINCFIYLPTAALLENDDPYQSDEFNIMADNTVQDYLRQNNNSFEYGPKRYKPLLPKTRSALSFLGHVVLNKNFKKYELKWMVHADNAEPMTGAVKLNDIKVFHY